MNAMNTVLGVFVWLLGLCIGSFLNVVIYRLPLGLSLSQPRWSFCPNCKATIAWHDNFPVLSWLLLRARCRNCRAPISIQYPLVEATTGLAFALVFALLAPGGARVGVPEFSWGLDWPLLLGWLILTAAMVACAGMDFVAYIIDVRVTHVALIAGLLLLPCWNRPEITIPVAHSPLAGGMTAAFLIGLAWTVLSNLRSKSESMVADEDSADKPESESSLQTSSGVPVRLGPPAVGCFIVSALGLMLAISAMQKENPWSALQYLVPAGFAVLMAVLSLAGGEPRESDEELHEALESEAPGARGTALRELAWLLPPLLGGALIMLLLQGSPAARAIWDRLVSVSVSIGSGTEGTPGVTLGFAGAIFSIHGAMVGIVLGWLVRILFTLIFGREAFGVGDIYILAAAGAVAGWDIVLLAFPLAVGVAIVMFFVSLLRKRTALLAFGPPLAMGFMLALWLNRPAAALAQRRIQEIEYLWGTRRDLALMGIGLMLVGAAVAVILARVVRRLIER